MRKTLHKFIKYIQNKGKTDHAPYWAPKKKNPTKITGTYLCQLVKNIYIEYIT